jgi:hypothetical protein
MITDKGLKTKRGRELTAQTFDALLRKPIYTGWCTRRVWLPVKACTPIVSQELFDTVQ